LEWRRYLTRILRYCYFRFQTAIMFDREQGVVSRCRRGVSWSGRGRKPQLCNSSTHLPVPAITYAPHLRCYGTNYSFRAPTLSYLPITFRVVVKLQQQLTPESNVDHTYCSGSSESFIISGYKLLPLYLFDCRSRMPPICATLTSFLLTMTYHQMKFPAGTRISRSP
jgi:hypothetical protein